MFSCGIVETFKNNVFQLLGFLRIELCCVLHKHDLVKEMVLDFFILRTENDKLPDDTFDAFLEQFKVLGVDDGLVGDLGIFELKKEL
jgi:hypothetical protein